jgi:hypothetical protein
LKLIRGVYLHEPYIIETRHLKPEGRWNEIPFEIEKGADEEIQKFILRQFVKDLLHKRETLRIK